MTQQTNLNKLITYRDYLNQKYYTEPPVDIIRFVEDPDFLGHSFENGKKWRPCWRKVLKEVFYDNDKYLVVFTGSTGTGKTSMAYVGMAYVLYKILILKNPWSFFGLADSGKFALAFFNLNKTLGMSKGFNTLQNYLLKSSWFKSRGIIRGREGAEKLYFDRIEYLLASPQAKGFGCLGEGVKIDLLNGRQLTIPEIMVEREKGIQHWVYSYNIEQNKMVPGKVVGAYKTKLNTATVTVLLDNGEKIVCTPDHPFLLKSGEYKEAKDLVSSDDLRSVFNHYRVIVVETSEDQDVYDLTIESHHNFLLSAGVFVHNTVGTHIVSAVMDEVDSPLESENSREKILQAYYSTVTRFKNRFVKNNKSISRFFLVSSKQDEMSFLNTFIDTMQKKSERMYVADINKWESEPRESYCGKGFFVSCGDAYNPPRILRATEDEKGVIVGQDEIDQLKMNGFNVLRVPVEYLEDFELDMVTSLRDIAGVAIAGLRKSKLFPSERMLLEAYDYSRENPVTNPLILTGLNDPLRLIDFIDFSKFTVGKTIPRYIHCDIAFSGDCLGLSMACVNGYTQKEQVQEDGTFRNLNVPIAHTDFVMRIKARDGEVIPLHRVREFILDLRRAGFTIVRYTSDLRLASEDTLQLLNKAGVKAEYFSVDKPIDRYIDYRNLVFEKRWNCFKHEHLHRELVNLEVDRDRCKIDHPKKIQAFERTEGGDLFEVEMEGSKDLADATVGAIINALQDAKPPIDLERMERLVKQVSDQSQTKSKEQSAIEALLTVGGKQAIGTVGSSAAVTKFANMLKGL